MYGTNYLFHKLIILEANMVYFGILLTILLFSLFIIWEVNKSLKEQNDTLIFLNKKLNLV